MSSFPADGLPDNLPAPIVVEGVVLDAEPEQDPRTARLAELAARRAQSMEDGQIDNGRLYAGSLMYYYCKFCGVLTDKKNEGWFLNPPITTCKDCGVLIELGWHDGVTPTFPLH